MYKVLLIADSRAHNFDAYKKPPQEELLCEYRVDFCVARGAKISDLKTEALEKLRHKRSRNPVIVKIAAGINDITSKVPHGKGSVVVPNDNNILTKKRSSQSTKQL